MIEPKLAKSCSNLSDDSWTLVEDEKREDDDYLHVTASDKNLPEPETVKEENVEVEKLKDDGFLTFDEYFQERLLEHDYEHDEKPAKLRKLYKGLNIEGMRKCKAAKLSIATFFVLILVLSGLVTLTSSYTNTYSQSPSSKLFKNHNHLGMLKNMTTLPVNLRKTIDYPPISETKLKSNHTESGHLNSPHQNFLQCNISEAPGKFKATPTLIGPLKNPEFKGIEDPIIKDIPNFEKLAKKFSDDIAKATKESKVGSTKSAVIGKNVAKDNVISKNINTGSTLREIIMSVNFHALASLIMTNVYLFMLATDLAHRRRNHGPTIFFEDTSIAELKNYDIDSVKYKKLLFQQLPFHHARYGKRSRLEGKNSVQTLTKVETKVKDYGTFAIDTLNKPEILAQTWSELTKSDLKHLFPTSLSFTSEEFGKSECQRRFEELDNHQRKFAQIKQVQKDRIKSLKQKFKNEVSHIKDTEEESAARAEKINSTSKKFVKRLKHNREKYLIEMKRMREIKAKIEKYGKEHNCGRSRSDVSVGNYTVTLPECYDFGKALKVVEKVEQPPTRWNLD